MATAAEAKLAERLGWDLSVVRCLEAAAESGLSGAYKIISPGSVSLTAATILPLLRIGRWQRFGNAVRQLRNVFYVADRYGATRIEFPGPHRFFEGDRLNDTELVWKSTSPYQARLGSQTPGLEGDFFFIGGLGLRPTAEEQARVVTNYVRPLLKQPLRQPHPEVRDDDVVLHFRAGDVFNMPRGEPVHREYGQPPLAYYLAAVDRERPARVWIVYEDRGNPTVDAAASALRANGLEVRMQSGDLATDLHVLLNAPCLVGAVGSFSSAVAALSLRMRKLYQYFPVIEGLRYLGIDVVVASDMDGKYDRAVRSDNWQALPEQLSLMLSYPVGAIGFKDYPALAPANSIQKSTQQKRSDS